MAYDCHSDYGRAAYPGQHRSMGGPPTAARSARQVTKEEKQESFFHWFSPPPIPASDAELDEDEEEQLQACCNIGYHVATQRTTTPSSTCALHRVRLSVCVFACACLSGKTGGCVHDLV
jgi:hypothetical protein